MKKKLELYYPEDSVVNIFSQPNKYLKDDYARYFSSEMLGLAVDKDFSGNDLRVFLGILANLGFDNIINIPQQELSSQLGIHRSDVAKSIKRLVSKGYLEIISTVGRQNIYMFNPSVAFKSKAKNLKDLKRAWNQQSFPNTKNKPNKPIDIDLDLELDLEDKLDDKVSQLSEQFNVPQTKVRQIILSLVDQALRSKNQENLDLPY
jgi:predicted transcriptional regulator